MNKVTLGNKAETLLKIQSKVKNSKILDQYICKQDAWRANPDIIIDEIKKKFGEKSLILRSCSIDEDNCNETNAGVFTSILDIQCNDTGSVVNAINKVFESYTINSSHGDVLIQPFLNDVALSGVILTCDLVSGAPYYIINYDDMSGITNSVTSGSNFSTKTEIIYRYRSENYVRNDSPIGRILKATYELENIFDNNKLNIEFAIDSDDVMYIFQVRPIVIKQEFRYSNSKVLSQSLKESKDKFNNYQSSSHTACILGDYTLFSGMTDWNPAEILGKKPNTLAMSLYNFLITDETWAKQRYEFGYRDVRPEKLIHRFCSQPYVDIRASLNSFIPASIPDEITKKLVNAYLNILKEKPNIHDKIEFDLVFTIWTPTFFNDAKSRFNNSEITLKEIKILEEALKVITARSFQRLDDDISSIYNLSDRFLEIKNSKSNSLDKVHKLLTDCKNFGTLPFAHSARAGFIAIILLKSCVRSGYLSPHRMLEFQSSISTVASELQYDLSSNMKDDDLIRKYGHLRPGTYDINQTAYWENPQFYFNRTHDKNKKKLSIRNFEFTKKEEEGFKKILDDLPTDINSNSLINYIKCAIQAREWTKLQFTKNISTALDLLVEYGKEYLDFTREEIGYMSYEDINNIRSGNVDKKNIATIVKQRKSRVHLEQFAKLPIFISSESNFDGYTQEKSQANYITNLQVAAELCFINDNMDIKIQEKIVCIESADPGYDWIFSHNIAGLITKYGGANSHMAIRCAELNIPASIGIGDKLYEHLHSGHVILDCRNEKIKNV